jgi:hypothetical protein
MLKRIIASLLCIGAVEAYAADNSTYIDQSGDNATVLIVQDGAGNRVRGLPGSGTSDETPAIMYGDSNQITISQVGSGNTMKFGAQTKLPSELDIAGYSGNIFYYNVKGNSNNAVIDSNGNGKDISKGNSIILTQTGNGNNAEVKMTGTANNLTATTSGGNSNGVISLTAGDRNLQQITVSSGSNNTVNISQTGNNNSVIGTAVGSGNNVNMSQDGFGHTATFDIIGNSNTVKTSQLGIGDVTPLNIVMKGSNNVIVVANGGK